MAEVTAMRNNALPYPVYALPYVAAFPLLDADGDPISPSSPDSEISKNGDTFADCTNEATEIATSSGICYLSLTSTELTTDVATVQIKSTGAKTTVLALYPRKLPVLRSGTGASGGASTSTIVLDSGASAVDDYYNGCIVSSNNDGTLEVRMITDYTGSSKTATVVPDWNLAPDNNDAFTVYIPDGRQIVQSDVTAISAVAVSTTTAQLGVNVVNAAGTAWNSGAIGATTLAADTITAAKVADGTIDAATFAASAITATAIAADAITAAKIADGAIDAATFATGAITATAIAADAIGASELAADAVAEIAAAVWDLDATGHQTTGTFGQAIGDPAANTATIYAAVVTNAAGTDVAADIIAIKAETASILTDTAEIGTAGAGLTNINLPNQTMDIVGNITGNLSGSVGSVTGAVGSVTGNVGGNVTGSIGSLGAQAKLDVNAEADTALADYDGPTHAELTTLIGTPADTDVSTDIANVQATVDGITAGSGLDAAGVRAAIGLASANLDTQLDALPTNAELTTALAGLNDISVSDILTTQMTESYAANGVAPTVAQALFAVQQFLMDKDISGTNYTVRKLDGSTTAFVATLNDAVAPTASTRT